LAIPSNCYLEASLDSHPKYQVNKKRFRLTETRFLRTTQMCFLCMTEIQILRMTECASCV